MILIIAMAAAWAWFIYCASMAARHPAPAGEAKNRPWSIGDAKKYDAINQGVQRRVAAGEITAEQGEKIMDETANDIDRRLGNGVQA